MERRYRCTSCGMRSRVVAADDEVVEAIHCPRCGGTSIYRPGWSDEPGGPVVQIDLTDPTDREAALTDEQLAEAWEGDPTRRDDGPTRQHTTPVGLPSITLSPTPSEPGRPVDDAVTTIPTIPTVPVGSPDDGPDRSHPVLPDRRSGSPPRADEPAGRRAAPLRPGPGELARTGVPWPGAQANGGPRHARTAPAEDIARGGRGMEGKAWSASGIRRALEAEGLGSVDDQPAMSVATPTRGMDALPKTPHVQIDVPEPRYRGDELPEQGVYDPYANDQGAETADDESTGSETRPSGAAKPPSRRGPGDDPYHPATPVSGRGLRDRPASSRVLLLAAVGAALISVGVVVGIIGYDRASQPDDDAGVGFRTMARDEGALAVASVRAERFGLDPIAPEQAVEAAWRIDELDYPERLLLTLRLTNRSGRPIAALHVTATWYLLHDAPAVAQTTTSRFDRAVNVAGPLASGDSTTTMLPLVVDERPTGPAIESFVWLEITAASDDLEIVFEGGAATFDVAVREGD